MRLQILVPQYKETEEVIAPLLWSIALQQGINIKEEVGVIICNDGTDVHLSQEFLDQFPYDIQYHLEEHGGVSATRNKCLSYATSDYVMWCDADDMFYSMCGLYNLWKQMEKEYDVIISKFIEETVKPDGSHVFVEHQNDYSFCHGKALKRLFLIDNNIYWNPDLTIHEDSYFNVRAWDLAQTKTQIDAAFYLWKHNPNSVCRSDPKYIFKTYSKLIDSIDGIASDYIDRGIINKATGQVVHTVYRIYYNNMMPDWKKDENAEYLLKLNKRFKLFYIKYQDLWVNASNTDKMTLSNSIRSDAIKKGMLQEDVTIDEWLQKILAL